MKRAKPTLALVALTALMALLIAGCGAFVAPAPTPAEMDDVIANLVLRGATVTSLVSGDAGCPGSELHNNAVKMTVTNSNLVPDSEIYLLRWRRDSDFASGADDFASCVDQFKQAHPGAVVDQIESDPWRAYSANWTAAVRDILQGALEAAGGT